MGKSRIEKKKEKTKVRIRKYRGQIEQNYRECSTKIKCREIKKEWLRDMQDRRRWSNMYFIGIPEVGNREQGEVIAKVLMVGHFQNCLKT